MKVHEKSNPEKYVLRSKQKCLCGILRPVLIICRSLGLAPFDWTHPKGNNFIKEDGQCHFSISKFWMCYSIMFPIILIILYYKLNDFSFANDYHTLSNVSDIGYVTFTTVQAYLGILKSRKLLNVLNSISPFLQRGLFCESSKLSLKHALKVRIFIILFYLGSQWGVIILFGLYGATNPNWAIDFCRSILSNTIHNIPFIFCNLFSTVVVVYVTLFMCFETAMLQVLTNCVSHDTTNEPNGIFKWVHCSGSCKGYHLDLLNDGKNIGTLSEDLDGLRRFHESIRMSLTAANEAFNPQLVIHLGVELVAITTSLYCIIWFYNLDETSMDTVVLNYLECIYVVSHLFALVMFLKSVHGIKTTVNIEYFVFFGIIDYLK